MSKYMQLEVRVTPYYKKNMASAYPHISSGLGHLNQAGLEKEPSFFDIVEKLDKLLYDLEGNPPFREILLKHQDKLRKLHKDVEANIADWDLAKADKALYQMEDIFDKIEWELG